MIWPYTPATIHGSHDNAFLITFLKVRILGHFPTARGQYKFLFMEADYFTKLVEAEAVTSITESEFWRFIWKNIITTFKVLRTIVFDNVHQLDINKVQDDCAEYGIQTRFPAVARPLKVALTL